MLAVPDSTHSKRESKLLTDSSEDAAARRVAWAARSAFLFQAALMRVSLPFFIQTHGGCSDCVVYRRASRIEA
jgi:hypothetical protein